MIPTAIAERSRLQRSGPLIDSLEYKLAQAARGGNGTVQLAENLQRKSAWKPMLVGTNVLESMQLSGMPYANPDDLASKKGVKVFAEMLRTCDMCNSATAYLLLAVLSPGWGWESGDPGDTEADRAKEFQEYQESRLRGTFQQMLLGRLDSAPRGFSVGELVWADRETEGEWIGKQRIGQVQDKNPYYIECDLDDFGQVQTDGIWQTSYAGAGNYIKAKLEEVMYWPFWPRDDSPYGTPLLRAPYQWYFLKQFTIKQWARMIEVRGHPIIYGTWDEENPPETGDRAAWLSWIKELRQNMAGIMSNRIEVKELNLERSNAENVIDVIMAANRAIARGLLLPALVMEKDSTGSLALGREQGDQFTWILEYLSAQLESVVNGQYVMPSHRLNFGDRIPAPVFKIKAHKQEDLQAKALMYGSVSLIGAPFRLDKLAEEFGDAVYVPEKEEDRIVGGRPAGGGILLPDGTIWGRTAEAMPQMPGATKAEMADLTEMIRDAAYGKLGPQKVYSFAARKDLTPLEKLQNFRQQEEDALRDLEDIKIQHILATEAIATDLADLAGKESGERRPE